LKAQDFLAGAARRVLKMARVNFTTPQVILDSFYQPIDPKPMLNGATSQVAKLFYGHKGRLIDKWGHYLDIYDRHFNHFRKTGRAVRLLEIGVYHGGSLQLWRQYFGPEALIFGIDIDPRCGEIADPDICIRVGSQADPEFLKGVVREMGGVDIVIDDGSHIASHQRKSLEILLPLLDPCGVYVAEDLHTSYFRGCCEGGFGRHGTFIEEVKVLIDSIHEAYHGKKTPFSNVRQSVNSVHVYDSLVFIEKKPPQRPFHTKVGTPSFQKD
jgi:methyltransferase family protein